MMFGVNISSIVITVVAMTISNEWVRVIEFLYYNPTTLWFNILTAICSATGQVAIYTTIKRYGPLVFSIIMTTRQVFSIIISNIIFGHRLSLGAYFGAIIVFGTIFSSVNRKNSEKMDKDVLSRESASKEEENCDESDYEDSRNIEVSPLLSDLKTEESSLHIKI